MKADITKVERHRTTCQNAWRWYLTMNEQVSTPLPWKSPMKPGEDIGIPFVWETWSGFVPWSELNKDRSAVERGGLEKIKRGFSDHCMR